MDEVTLDTTQKVNTHIAPEDAQGNPAPVDGAPTWSNPANGDFTLAPADDGLSCFFVSGSTVGDFIYQVDADADMGQGVQTITKQFTAHVTSPMASQLIATFDPPVAK